MIRQISLHTALTSLALFGATAFATGASAAPITGTVSGAGANAYAFTSTDFTYSDGSAYSTTPVTIICLIAWASAPATGTTYTLEANYGASALVGGGGDLGIAGVNYLLDNYYTTYFLNGAYYEQWAFQQVLWEFGTDFNASNLSSFDPTWGNGDPTYYDNYTDIAAYNEAWQTMYADVGAALATLDPTYTSTKYTVDFLDGLSSGIQNFVAISELPDVAPIPVPAAAPLLLAGLGALGFAARRKRA